MTFQNINFARSNSFSLKCLSFTPSGCKYIRIRKLERSGHFWGNIEIFVHRE